MSNLRRTPSIQHAVALVRGSVEDTIQEFRRLDELRVPFSLNPGRRMIKPMMEGCHLDWVIRQLSLDKHSKNIAPNIGLVEAFYPYAKNKSVQWFRECETHGYPIGSGIIIPIRPAGYWFDGAKLHVLWPQCWKGRTLDPTQKAIFNTILRETFFVGDFRNAELEWVDLREQSPKAGRSVEILPGDSLGTVSRSELADYLHILVKAFEQFSVEKAVRKEREKRSRKPKDSGMPLFD